MCVVCGIYVSVVCVRDCVYVVSMHGDNMYAWYVCGVKSVCA